MLGLKQNVCRVQESRDWIISSDRNVRHITNSIIEINEVRVRLPDSLVTLPLNTWSAVRTGVGKRLHTLPSHPAMREPQGI